MLELDAYSFAPFSFRINFFIIHNLIKVLLYSFGFSVSARYAESNFFVSGFKVKSVITE